MNIYIASSWKHKAGVTMLTQLLRQRNHNVISWIENSEDKMISDQDGPFNFEKWVNTPNAQKCFDFDTRGIINSNLVIYYGNAGKDAAAEVGIAWAHKIRIIGLKAKGEDFGLMRKLISNWYDDINLVLQSINCMNGNHSFTRLVRQARTNGPIRVCKYCEQPCS